MIVPDRPARCWRKSRNRSWWRQRFRHVPQERRRTRAGDHESSGRRTVGIDGDPQGRKQIGQQLRLVDHDLPRIQTFELRGTYGDVVVMYLGADAFRRTRHGGPAGPCGHTRPGTKAARRAASSVRGGDPLRGHPEPRSDRRARPVRSERSTVVFDGRSRGRSVVSSAARQGRPQSGVARRAGRISTCVPTSRYYSTFPGDSVAATTL